MSLRRAAVVCCLLALAPASAPADGPPDPGLYAGLRWRCIGPFRGGRTVGATGVPGQPYTFLVAAVNGSGTGPQSLSTPELTVP